MIILNCNFLLPLFLLQLSITLSKTFSIAVPTPPSSSTNSPLTAAATASSSLAKLSPEIVNELKDFLDLIPSAVVDEIVAKHYIIDGNFRTALKYLRSTQFTRMLQQIQQIPEITEILDFLHLRVAAVKTTSTPHVSGHAIHDDDNDDVEGMRLEQEQQQHVNATCEMLPQLDTAALSIVNNNIGDSQIEIILLNTIKPSSSSQAGYEKETMPRVQLSIAAYNLGTFNTFLEELIEHLPRDRYVQMINEKRQKSAPFAQFYLALRSAKLRPMVDATMKSANLDGVIKTLHSNGIDVKSLETIAFKVISWGPPLPSSPPVLRVDTLLFS